MYPTMQDKSLRPDGAKKGKGWLGEQPLKMPDGSTGVATEYSVQSGAVKVDGKQIDFPSLVPTLTAEERKMMLEDVIPNNKPPPESVMQKAIEHAKKRLAAGQSPFAD
jgi:hypothetical protein